jgi:flagellar protein FliL
MSKQAAGHAGKARPPWPRAWVGRARGGLCRANLGVVGKNCRVSASLTAAADKSCDSRRQAVMAQAKKPKPEAASDAADGGAPPPKKLAGKTLILFIVLPALLILGGGGAAAFMLLGAKDKGEVHADASAGKDKKPKKDDKKKKDEHAKGGKDGKDGKDAKAASGPVVTEGDGVYFVALPGMLVNIAGADGRAAFLKLKLTLEAPDEETVAAIEAQLPKVMDQFQGFLRELRMDDLTGSAGSYRLRLELLRRVNLAVAPAEVNSVLIEEMLVQ